VQIPTFSPGDDPGPDFAALLRRQGLVPDAPSAPVGSAGAVTHGTTVVAIRYADGVVMAGDRRATSGHLISHRSIEKVFPADRWSGVAIAGAAGPAMEMVKLFQLQLEHYEKVEGWPLSLEGKANQLSAMVRNHLPAAMQGWPWCRSSPGTTPAGGPVGCSSTTSPAVGTKRTTTPPPDPAACTPPP
jgi:proteasome beta subunit